MILRTTVILIGAVIFFNCVASLSIFNRDEATTQQPPSAASGGSVEDASVNDDLLCDSAGPPLELLELLDADEDDDDINASRK
ncbi:hypothetical protein BOX15_Mlig022665g2 [Macrostomum lignano]|uniref:Uncharacterized protein n=1 Tax=Macrostomum lignano TaxID=282301 RepID=A0A267FZ67_9PLAT|nr:hypothetical protein BOX15_Mlig022665g2 [Macrostomum lignano]